MPTTAKHRRAYFALVRELGLSEEDRHNFNEQQTGKRSSKKFSRQDWKDVVAEMQRLNGQDTQPGRPRLKTEHPLDIAAESGDWCTGPQCALIEHLADEIEWRVGRHAGPASFVGKRVFMGEESELRRQILWKTKGPERWRCLTRVEAGEFILALRNMVRVSPAKTDANFVEGGNAAEGR